LISRHESKKKNKEKVQKGNSPRQVKGAKGEQFQRAPKVTRPQLAKGEQLAKANRRRALKASNSREHQRLLALNSPKANQRRATRNGE